MLMPEAFASGIFAPKGGNRKSSRRQWYILFECSLSRGRRRLIHEYFHGIGFPYPFGSLSIV
jgi:hypothetical protein